MERRRTTRGARTIRWVGLLGLVGAALAGCSDDTASESSDSTVPTSPTAPIPIATSPSGADDPNYPMDVVDCGGRVSTFVRPPERLVALDETAAETLVRLGERDLIVGIVRDHPDEALWELTEAELSSRQVIADASTPLTREAVERVGPDLLVAAEPARLEGPTAASTRQQWAEAGIGTFLFRADCELPGGSDDETDGLERYYADLRALAAVLGEPVKGEKLVSEGQAAMQTLTREVAAAGADELTVWIRGGEGVDGGPHTIAQSVVQTLGAEVVAADADPADVIAADPDLIWLITPRGEAVEPAAAELRAELVADPVVASLDAVQRESFVVTAAADISPSPRFTQGARALVDALLAG